MMMLGGLVAITSLTTAATAAAAAAPFMPTVEIAPGIEMPALSLGTCCGSSPSVGLAPWLTAGGLGVDTAYDYSDQTVIARILASTGTKRESLFITSKIPAGFGGPKDCSGGAEQAMATVKTNLEQLNTTYIDLVLLHKPCHSAAENNALWKGLEQAKSSGLVRAIGVSNYKAKDLMALQGTVPAVNQCLMSVSLHDDATISYCQAHNITYEAYEARRPFPSWNRCILTEIYLCHACSYQEIKDGNGRAGCAGAQPVLVRATGSRACLSLRRHRARASHQRLSMADLGRHGASGTRQPRAPVRACSPSIFLDKNRRDIGKSQSEWMASCGRTAEEAALVGAIQRQVAREVRGSMKMKIVGGGRGGERKKRPAPPN
jgi:diketogulonate reductase-like aldo/keto reductase